MSDAHPARAIARAGLALLPALLVAPLIASCLGGGSAEIVCPRVSVLPDADRVTKFRPGPGRDLTDVLFQGRLGGYQASCTVDEGEVVVDLGLLFLAQRGPADLSRVGVFEYFVAITDPSGAVVAKENFTARVEFQGEASRDRFVEELVQKIPVNSPEEVERYAIFAGFQLSSGELEFNRSEAVR